MADGSTPTITLRHECIGEVYRILYTTPPADEDEERLRVQTCAAVSERVCDLVVAYTKRRLALK